MASIPLDELHAQAPFLRRLARALVRDEDAALDLVQETWVAALRQSPREGEEARGFFARLLRTRARSARRADARRVARERAAGQRRAGGGGGPEVAERVLAAVLALEEPSKSVILRRYYEDLAPSAIAARTGTPLKTVEARLARARAELRQKLDGDFGGRAAWGVALASLAGLERPARLSTVALALAAAGLCGAAAVGWRLGGEEAPAAAAPVELAGALAPPPAEPAVALAEPARAASERAAERAEPSAEPAPAATVDPLVLDLLERHSALVTGRVEGPGLIAPWVGVVPAGRFGVLPPFSARPCDPDGFFALEISVDERFRHSGEAYLVAVAEQRAAIVDRVFLQPGSVVERTLELDDAGAVAKGLVAERSSAPVPRARVRLWLEGAGDTLRLGPYQLAPGKNFALATRDLVADEYGRFEAFGFASGRHRAAVLAPEVEGVMTLQLLDLDGGERVELSHWTLALAPGLAVIELEVVGPEGPLDGVAVVRADDTPDRRRRKTAMLHGLGYVEAPELPFTDPENGAVLPDDGRLRVAFDPRAETALVILRAGFKEGFLDLRGAQGDRDGRLQVLLEPLDDPADLVLSLDLVGDPPSAFEVALTPQSDGVGWAPPIRSVVPAAGRLVQVLDVPPGEYHVALTPVGESDVMPAATVVRLAPGEEHSIAVELVRGGAVRLVAVGGPASPEGLELLLERRLGLASKSLVCTPREVRELAAGEAVELAPRVPPGTWRARLMAGGKVLWKGEARIKSGGVFDVPLAAR